MTPRMERIRRGFEPAPLSEGDAESAGPVRSFSPSRGRTEGPAASPSESAREFMSALLPRRRVRTFTGRCVWCGGRCYGKVCADCRDLEAIHAGRAE